ncbi:hypothetical protein [Burkholderia sp. SCN-KJ]|uniref:hypothetical protein n=1 Tax=Burkholderia sp. SCN-KJ TaxID=2969248 RepID=UPI0021503A47|nr:hypothetical protein [Burkholderia sp. SCN-KJ]MCR4465928.1 hypothetical protein [Burkholderia sp. SCN-KJ]
MTFGSAGGGPGGRGTADHRGYRLDNDREPAFDDDGERMGWDSEEGRRRGDDRIRHRRTDARQ